MKGHPWGQKINDSWSGMIGLLVEGEVDIAAGDYSYTSQRDQAIDYLHHWYEGAAGVVIPVDMEEAINQRLIFDNFFQDSYSIWGITLAFGLFILLLHHICSLVRKRRSSGLNLRWVEVVCLIFYRKFIAQCK